MSVRQARATEKPPGLMGRITTFLLNTAYPPRCGGCDKRGTLFCSECRSTVVSPQPTIQSMGGIDALFCAGIFGGPLRQAIHRFKYESDSPLAVPLAELLVEAISRERGPRPPRSEKPLLIPVPLHGDRERKRGYNQCELLAEELSPRIGWPVSRGLVRVRATRTQVGLHEDERRVNVLGAFAWNGGEPPAHAMLVDDVCTTGATLSECASELRRSGVRHVHTLVLARAPNAGPHAGS